uniref:Uncharacterized protein n=1 Tax=Trichuris muris TaxID=70415 RepID=A0A5S6Q8C9_TRIMR
MKPRCLPDIAGAPSDEENRFPSRVSYQFLREKHFLNHLLRFYESYIGQRRASLPETRTAFALHPQPYHRYDAGQCHY